MKGRLTYATIGIFAVSPVYTICAETAIKLGNKCEPNAIHVVVVTHFSGR